MPITALPTPPSRSDSANFAARGDAFNTALPIFASEATALEINVNAKETSATTQASNAASSASAALASQAAAANSANAAATSAGASIWVSGTTYALGDVRWSPVTRFVYRRIVAGAGATDPSADIANWTALQSPWASVNLGNLI